MISIPNVGFISTRIRKRNRCRIEEPQQNAMEIALVRSQRGVIESPISEIIHGAVAVPLLGRQIDRNLHPVALRLVISEHRRRIGAGVGVERDGEANQNGEEAYAEEPGFGASGGDE